MQIGFEILRAWVFEAVMIFCGCGVASVDSWFGDGEFPSLRRLAEGIGAAMAVGGVWKGNVQRTVLRSQSFRGPHG